MKTSFKHPRHHYNAQKTSSRPPEVPEESDAYAELRYYVEEMVNKMDQVRGEHRRRSVRPHTSGGTSQGSKIRLHRTSGVHG